MSPHSPIILKNIGLFFPQKICFEEFSTEILFKQRIGLLGSNGSGKSTLLKIIQGSYEPPKGQAFIPKNTFFASVPQIVDNFDSLSGGERFNKALSKALSQNPNCLLLDEPTNHLDFKNCQSLMRMLQHCAGTLIIASHDEMLLRTCVDMLWAIEDKNILTFPGTYDEYKKEQEHRWKSKLEKLESLEKEKKKIQKALQAEYHRAAQSKRANHYENDRKLKGALKEKGSRTSGRNLGRIQHLTQQINEEVQNFRLPETIALKFSLISKELNASSLLSIHEGICGYQMPILKNISMTICAGERIVIMGNNGSGKTTFIRALLDDPFITKTGQWVLPKRHNIGYLDQHYQTLKTHKTVFESIHDLIPTWSHEEIRQHLNNFLFRKNEEVQAPIHTLSGGEKARLSLAQIAAKTPSLLILDEITNNLDLETKQYILRVLQKYPGALLVVSHEADFLKNLNLTSEYEIFNSTLRLR